MEHDLLMKLLFLLVALLAVSGGTLIAVIWAHDWQKTRLTRIEEDIKAVKDSQSATSA